MIPSFYKNLQKQEKMVEPEEYPNLYQNSLLSPKYVDQKHYTQTPSTYVHIHLFVVTISVMIKNH